MIKTIKLVSKEPIEGITKAKIKDIFETSKNPNQVLLDNVPEFCFMQGDVLYFTTFSLVFHTFLQLPFFAII